MKTRSMVVSLPAPLIEALDAVCKRLRLRTSFVVEAALREKIEDLVDAEDMCEAVKGATRFHPWEDIKAEVGKKGRK